MSMKAILPRHLDRLRTQGAPVHLLDVRTPAEHAEIHVADAHLLPLDRLDGQTLCALDGFRRDLPVYLLCRSGHRAKRAATQLEKEGFTQCVVVDGGIEAWASAGLPVVRGPRKVISLERQVRIAAGSIVLAGLALGAWVHPVLYGLSAFVGAGLVFAGISDWCGMALILARMPWNQAGTCVANTNQA
jgi:rhodanese-related sulfurtransferase